MIKFSIITCTWNSASFVRETIESVQSQKYPNLEHIFVDGGSTDGTLQIIQSLRGDVKWVTNVRGGIANAMNEGVKLASGDVVAHLHSDDYYLDNMVIEDVAAAFAATGARWLYGRTKIVTDGHVAEPGWPMPDYSYQRLLRGNFIMHPATFVERELFLSAGGFAPSIKYAMDYDLWLRLGRVAEPAYLQRFVAGFRHHSGSLSTSNPLAAFEDDFGVRMSHVGPNLLRRCYHYLYYMVRRRRLLRQGNNGKRL